MIEFLNQFEDIILDLNQTFMFGGDRFSLSEDYYQTYRQHGGDTLDASQVSRAINGAFNTLEAIYLQPARHDDFPNLKEVLAELPESCQWSEEEQVRIVDVFAVHELGTISTSDADSIKYLANSHRLHLISNIWSPHERFLNRIRENQLEACFQTITFSSDTRSVKPSQRLFMKALEVANPESTVMVGDSLRCDIAAADNLGIQTIWLSNGNPRKDSQPRPTWTVKNLQALTSTSLAGDDSQPAEDLISDTTLHLRHTTENDLRFVLDAETDEVNAPFIVNWTYQQHQQSIAHPDIAHLMIVSEETKLPIGYMILRGLSSANGPIELKRLVVTEKGKGFGKRSLALLKQYVFDRLNRHRLWLNVLTTNTRARSLYLAMGFRCEGIWRDSFAVGDEWVDLELMTVLSTDLIQEKTIEIQARTFCIIRHFNSQHIRQFCELYDREWPNATRSHADLETALHASDFFIGITEQNSGDLVGFCRVTSDRRFRAWIHGLIVREDLRGYGIGKLIMDEVIDSPEMQGLHSIRLTCAPGMLAFYEKWGFEVFENEAVMTLPLRSDLC